MTTCLQFVDWLKDWFYDKTDTDTLLSSKSNTSHKHTTWTTKTLTHGTLYVNEDLRLCELHYNYSGFFISGANAWTFVETDSTIADYPPVNTIYTTCSNFNLRARVFNTGSIQVYSSSQATMAVAFNLVWHY